MLNIIAFRVIQYKYVSVPQLYTVEPALSRSAPVSKSPEPELASALELASILFLLGSLLEGLFSDTPVSFLA